MALYLMICLFLPLPLLWPFVSFRFRKKNVVLVRPMNGCSFAGKLLGHLFTIVDVAVNEKDQQLISLSTARVRNAINIHYKCKLVNAGFSK